MIPLASSQNLFDRKVPDCQYGNPSVFVNNRHTRGSNPDGALMHRFRLVIIHIGFVESHDALFGHRQVYETMLNRLRHRASGRRRSRNTRPRKIIEVDERGMPIGYSHMLVVDEFGNVGRDPKEHERTFGYALTDVTHPRRFESLTEHNRESSDDEIKASSDKQKYRITEGIALLEFPTYGVYLDKSDPPQGWERRDRARVMRDVLDLSIGTVLKDIDGNVYIVVDYHTAYRGKVPILARDYSDEYRIVEGDTYNSEGGQFEGVLQTHDYVANSMHSMAELDDDTRTRRLGTKIRRITKEDRIGRNKE